jgi:signal transduction histidine kinase
MKAAPGQPHSGRRARMHALVDKAIIFLCCLVIHISGATDGFWVVPVIAVLTLSSLNGYFEKPWLIVLSFALYSFLCIIWGSFLIFLPLIFYDVIIDRLNPFHGLVLIPMAVNLGFLPVASLAAAASLTVLSAALRLRTLSYCRLRGDYFTLRDKATEISTLLENKNAELIANQNHEINVATLRERNRIAREIHDNLGHLLSRCLLQIGAMMAVNKDSDVNEGLSSIKGTISRGMDSIRESVHNLHDESIDLHERIRSLVGEFTFCPVKLNYDIAGNPDMKLKYTFISIVKEALTNIMKHSNATMATVTLTEHPGFYQLVIHDNGTAAEYDPDKGIGIRNICDRALAFGGNVNISTDNGFKIFASFPKENG